MKRGLTIDNILNKKYKTFDFKGQWFDAFGKPETTGVWFIWGNSGNGKTSFLLQLIKELSKFDRIFFNSLEEGTRLTMRQGLLRTGFKDDVNRKKVLVEAEDLDELIERLEKPKSQNIVVIDSFQHFQMQYREYLSLREKFPNKLIVFISHAKGKEPKGNAAIDVMYDADLKIWVEGFRAFSKGRYFGEKEYFTIYDKRAIAYWGEL